MKIRAVITCVAAGFLAFSLAGPAPGQTPEPNPQAFKLTLEDCIKLGIENSPQLKMAQANVDYAKGKLLSAGANLVPKINASATYVHSNMLPQFNTSGKPTLIPTTFPFANDSTPLTPDHIHYLAFPGFEMTQDREGDVYGLKLEVTYALFTGGRAENGYNAAKLALDASTVDLRQQRENLVYQIRQTYYSVLLAQEMVKVVDQSYKTMQDHYSQVQALYKEGYVSNLDLIQVEAKLSSIRPQQIQATNGLHLAKVALANLLNLDPSREVEVVGTLDYYPEDIQPLEEVLKRAMNNRPELQSMAIRKKQAESLVKIAQGAALPTVALFANYQWNRGQEMPPNDQLWRDGYQAGVSASMPLFDGFSAYGETKAAKGQLQQATWGEQALRNGIQTEVTANYLQLLTARESVEAEKKNVEAAEKNFDAAEKRYREGYVNQLDVLDAEVNLTAARAGYLRAISNYLTAKAALEKAMGLEV